jgi:hypothetical protein
MTTAGGHHVRRPVFARRLAREFQFFAFISNHNSDVSEVIYYTQIRATANCSF